MLGNVNPNVVVISALTTNVYRGHDNETAVQFLHYVSAANKEVPLNFADVDRMVLTFPDTDPVIAFDSALDPTVFDWATYGSGIIRFNLSQYALPVGAYNAELVAYDAEHPNGQVIISRYQPRVEFVLNVLQVGTTGSQPLPIPPGGDSAVREAGEQLSALRLVYESQGLIYYVNATTGLGVDQLLGITLTGGDTGARLVVQRLGTIDDRGWSWAEGLIFAGDNGTLTQTPPTIGWELVVGYAPSATRLNIDFDEPVELA